MKTAERRSVALVLPAYDEAETIGQAIREADEALAAYCADYEVLVVDDGSTDDTAELAEAEALRRPRVRVIRHARNRGYGAALATGFSAARMELVGFTDADCQFDLRQIDRLILLCSEHDVACGYRLRRQDPPLRRFLAKGYNGLVNLLLGIDVRDCDCAFKLFRRDLLQSLVIETHGFFINAEILAKLRQQGASVVEVGVTHRPRLAGVSKVSPLEVFPVFRTLLRFWWSWMLFPPAGTRTTSAPAVVWSGRRIGAMLVLLTALAVPLLTLGGGHSLIAPDETRYARIPAEMMASGDFVTPTLEGEPYLDKPPLLYWLTSASYLALGQGEWSARWPTAVAALLTVLLVYGVGRRLVGDRAAAFGALILATSGGVLATGRFLTTDGLLTACVTACFLAAYLGAGQDRFRSGWWFAAGLAAALGILTKGVVVLALCLPPLLATRWLSHSSVRLSIKRWALFLVPSVLLAGPWLVLISRRQPGFISYFFWRHHVVRYLEAFDHQQPWWVYLPLLLVLLFPFSALLPELAALLAGRSPTRRRLRDRELGYLLLAAAWTIFFFSLSSSKLPSYILPALPPIALLLGRLPEAALLHRARPPEHRRLAWVLPRRIAIGGLVMVIVLTGFDIGFDGQIGLGGHAAAWALLGAALLASVWLVRARAARTRAVWVVAAAISWVAFAFLFGDLYPEVANLKALPKEATVLAQQLRPKPLPIVALGRRMGPGLFYMRGDEIDDYSPSEIRELLAEASQHPRTILVTEPSLAEKVRALLPSGDVIEVEAAENLFLIRRRARRPKRFAGGRTQAGSLE